MAGWKIVDCGSWQTETRFKFTGIWHYGNNGSAAFFGGNNNGTKPEENIDQECAIEFYFIGTQLRIYMQTYYLRSKQIDVYIDKEPYGSYSLYGETVDRALVYEQTGLENKQHYVKLVNRDPDRSFSFDAISIDYNGQILDFIEPEPARYLLHDNTGCKTITNGNLQEAEKANIVTVGFTDLQLIKEVSSQIGNPYSLLRYDTENANTAIQVEHLPEPQLIVSVGDIDLSAYSAIKSITLTTAGSTGTVRVALSFDSGTTWQTYVNGWQDIELSTNALMDNGITASALSTITSLQWGQIFTGGTLRIAYCLSKTSVTDDIAIDGLAITGDTASWNRAAHMTDYDYEYPNPMTLVVHLLKDGSYKINYMEAK